jgi:hypothetical protein
MKILTRKLIYIFFSLLLLISIYILALPIWLDFIIWFFLLLTLKTNIQKLVLLSLIILIAFLINMFTPTIDENKIFYRPHDKFSNLDSYKKNVNINMDVEYGDLYHLDNSLNNKKEHIKQKRSIKFITDEYGFRNDINTINESRITLLGDSYIIGTGSSQEDIPSNQLSKISGLKVSSLAYVGDPEDYEKLAIKYKDIVNKNSKFILFYFEGNDFWENKNITIPLDILIRKKYLHMEVNKDRILKKIYNNNNLFFRKIRRVSHLINKKYIYVDQLSPVDIKKIGNSYVGFHKTYSSRKKETYIFKDNEILDRIIGVFFIPTKSRTYSKFLNLRFSENSFNYLLTNYKKLSIPVVNLSELFEREAIIHLKKKNYLYWRDDTHWNPLGIKIAMQCVNKFILEIDKTKNNFKC